MTLPAAVARQYLKAMGIESWESRDSEPVVTVTGQNETVQLSNDIELNPGSGLLPACQSNVESFLQKLPEAPVKAVNIVDAGILVLLEAPELAAAGQELLASMFKAIDVDLQQQGCAYLNSDPGTETVRSAVAKVQPSVIIAMVQCQRGVDELAMHRAKLHKLNWSGASVAITLHPDTLLNSPALKRPAWEDLKRVKASLDS